MAKLIIGVVVVTLVLIVVMSKVESYYEETTDTTLVSNNTLAADDQITATISGEVVRPGTYILDDDTKLIDLINAASGLTSNADSDTFFENFVLSNNLSFYIGPLYDNANTCSAVPIEKININTADKATLMTLNAIGDTLANSIISYRNSNQFNRLEDIKNVTGVGNATFEKIKDYIKLK